MHDNVIMHIVTECIIDVNVYLRSCASFLSVFLDITYSTILINYSWLRSTAQGHI